MKNSFYGILLLLCIACKPDEKKVVHEPEVTLVPLASYTHDDGSICKAQSPINILSFKTNDEEKHSITFHFKDEIEAVENLGHTVQLDFKSGSTIEVDNETFDFKQLHFHTPSEHLIDGITYPMEMHIVNTIANQKEGEEPQYLVLSLLFKMGASNRFIEEFITYIPEEKHGIQVVDQGIIKISDLIQKMPEEILDHYYHYKGSLTTPPYTESVRWYVSKTIFEASPEQIIKILEIEGANARQIQGINQRKLESK